MRLLVSVSNAAEARDALLGGADIIDAKDPAAGPLGAVTPVVLGEICAAAAHARPVSAALGDAGDVHAVERATATAAALGVSAVKIGFAGRPTPVEVRALLDAALRGATFGRQEIGGAAERECGVFAVAYADWTFTHGPSPDTVLAAAATSRVRGVLIDTADKAGPGLRGLLGADVLGRWVRAAREAGLQTALAGKLSAADTPLVSSTGADIMGVRGAVCELGRTSRISVDRVRHLLQIARGGGASGLRSPAPPETAY